MSAENIVLSDKRAGLGAAPVSAENPAGVDSRASPEFEAVEAEVRKLEVDGPNAVDWKKVEQGAATIIGSQSKDFLAAAWCAFALFRGEGLPGLAVGLLILKGIAVEHWEGAFPPTRRERARVAAIDWLSGRLAAPLAEMQFKDADAANVMAVYDALIGLEEAMSAKLQKETLSVADLLRPLRPAVEQARRMMAEAAQKAEAEARASAAAAEAAATQPQTASAPTSSAPSPAAPASGQSAPAATPASPVAPPQAGASLPELSSALDALAPTLRVYAQSLRGYEPGDARAFVLARVASWLRIDALPMVQNGRTLVTPPDSSLEAIEAARGQKQWPVALASAEELIWTAPFCLDAHRHSYEALGEMGAAFSAARGAVLGMLRYFVQRHSGILELTFKDGRPFADEATQELAAAGTGSGGGQSTGRDEMAVAVAQARTLLGAGKAAEALDSLSQTLRRAASGRQRVMWQMAQAQFCIEQGFVGAALPLVEHLDRMVGERDLERWEPDLAASIAELRLRTLMHSDSQSVLSEDRRRTALEDARGRMARLDIGAAVRLLRA